MRAYVECMCVYVCRYIGVDKFQYWSSQISFVRIRMRCAYVCAGMSYFDGGVWAGATRRRWFVNKIICCAMLYYCTTAIANNVNTTECTSCKIYLKYNTSESYGLQFALSSIFLLLWKSILIFHNNELWYIVNLPHCVVLYKNNNNTVVLLLV